MFLGIFTRRFKPHLSQSLGSEWHLYLNCCVHCPQLGASPQSMRPVDFLPLACGPQVQTGYPRGWRRIVAGEEQAWTLGSGSPSASKPCRTRNPPPLSFLHFPCLSPGAPFPKRLSMAQADESAPELIRQFPENSLLLLPQRFPSRCRRLRPPGSQ